MRTALIIAGALTLSACASNGPSGPPGAHFARLAAQCSERGGSLVPSFSYGSSGSYSCSSGAAPRPPFVPAPREVR